jgi:hypothetical protein
LLFALFDRPIDQPVNFVAEIARCTSSNKRFGAANLRRYNRLINTAQMSHDVLKHDHPVGCAVDVAERLRELEFIVLALLDLLRS